MSGGVRGRRRKPPPTRSWDKDVSGAIAQIKNKDYCRSLEEYRGNVLLVGVNYDKKTKVHECMIEECEIW